MAESYSYRDSINFYERMSTLQGDLKGYESEQFQLEEEFQRLWTQGPSLPSSNNGGDVNITSLPSGHLVNSGHLTSQSQLLANPSNLNYYGRNEEVDCRRRARNQAILEKLQELETNASIFAARSERLRMMKDEYETLVRKYGTNRKWTHHSEEASNSHNYQHGQRFSSSTRPKSEKTRTADLTSTGVNTDITGPIRPLSLSMDSSGQKNSVNNIEAPSGFRINLDGDRRAEKLQSTPKRESNANDFLHNDDEHTFTTKQTISRRPTFLDISSTSDSEFPEPKLKEHQQDNLDETSADTTSLSVLLPKSRGSNYMLNVSTDGSLSDSTSMKQLAISKTILKKNFTFMANSSGTTSTSTLNNKGSSSENNKRNENKELVNHVTQEEEDAEKSVSHPDEECSSTTDSTSHSVGDSVMDSVQNKTPESLPRDDSELLHITEVDEEEDSKFHNKDQPNHYWGENNKPTKLNASMLINEMENQNQETWDNLSSSNLVRVAQKEIEFRNVGGESQMNHKNNEEIAVSRTQKNQLNQINNFDNKMDKGSNNADPIQNDDDMGNNNHERSSAFQSSLQSSKVKNEKSDGLVKGELKAPSELHEESVKEVKEFTSNQKSKELQEHSTINPQTTKVDFSSRRKDFNSNSQNPALTSSSHQSKGQQSIIRSSTAGNANKKVRLKLDYDDSESEASEIAPIIPVTQNNKQIMNQKDDDDFDDFYV